jgi:biopolymer transport protein TolQ
MTAGRVKLRLMPTLILQAHGEAALDIISLLLNASPVVKGVLGLLILMSVASWFVIGSKALYLSNAASRSTKFQDNFWKTGRLDEIWRYERGGGAVTGR